MNKIFLLHIRNIIKKFSTVLHITLKIIQIISVTFLSN